MDKNNVILLTVDCLRADHIGHLGANVKTPNIDKLARNGISFSNAISNGANTPSSFPAIMTSTFPRLHLMEKIDDDHKKNPYWLFLNDLKKTVAELFKENGYLTAGIHSNPYLVSLFGYNRGFDYFKYLSDTSFINRELSFINSLKYNFNRVITLLRFLKGNYNELNSAEIINRLGLEWIKNRMSKNNFFIWLHYMDIHIPYFSPNLSITEKIKAIILSQSTGKNSNISTETLSVLKSLYEKSIEYFDHELGKFISNLENLGINYDNTYFLLTADHGEQLMDHGVFGHGLLYDEVIRVPLILVGPNICKNVVSDSLICHLDLSPTLCDLCNITPPINFQGTSFLKLTKNKQKKEIRNYVITEDIEVKQYSYRDKNYKYAIYFDRGDNIKREELYNIIQDKKENNNIEDRQLRMKFRNKILNHINKNIKNVNNGVKIDLDNWEENIIKERLKKLGYIE